MVESERQRCMEVEQLRRTAGRLCFHPALAGYCTGLKPGENEKEPFESKRRKMTNEKYQKTYDQ
jgi:hypothetical protein